MAHVVNPITTSSEIPSPQNTRHVWNLLDVFVQGRTYKSLLYLSTAFPFGLTYCTILLVGLSVGIGAAPLIGGLFILLLTFWASHHFARFERYLTMWWLDVEISPPAPLDDIPARLRERLIFFLRNPFTWKSLSYLLLKFVFGTISLLLLLLLPILSLSAILSPISYVIDSLIYQPGQQQFNVALLYGLLPLRQGIEPVILLLSLLLALLGVALLMGSLYLFRGMASMWAHIACVLLGMGDAQARLAEAQAIATREHERAERAEMSRRELIVNASHELRTPIASIRAHLDALLPEEGHPFVADPAHYLTIAQREAERLGALVDDLLALARADANELRLEVRPTSCGPIVEEVYQALAPLARSERKITLIRQVDQDLLPVLADGDRLAQVLLNLVRNAISYTPDGGVVSIQAARSGTASVEITVSDTGIGIPEDDLERVFDRFYRTDASRSRSSGGFGLGLSISRDLVQAMGGLITVTSTIGEGSTFRVTLRVALHAPQQ